MTAVVNSTIRKSVRIPADIVDYVEQQPGKDFTEKLVNLLYEVIDGEDKRKCMIEEYDRLIQERRIRLANLNQKVNDASVMVNRLQVFCVAAEAAGLSPEPLETK